VESDKRDGESSFGVGYLFGGGTFDVGARQWIAKGAARTLERKPFELLSYLIAHRHRAVTRAELLRAVWGDAAVCEGAIPQCVWTVRRTIGDTNGTRPLIATLKGVGYRFVAPVREYAPPLRKQKARASTLPGNGSGKPTIWRWLPMRKKVRCCATAPWLAESSRTPCC
jgi:DNA-binding winged helix-turn-helix (wHTH) protein